MGILGSYINGNYTVTILHDGTKIRYTKDNHFAPEKPESMDVKITNRCNLGCGMCHENSTCDGPHGDILNLDFIKTLNPYTEIAIGGGNPLSHPDLVDFLYELKEYKLIPNLTINQKHFMQSLDFIHKLVDAKLIYGIGVSLTSPDKKFIKEIKKFPNAVIHVINGCVTREELKNLAHKDLKILILGYKNFRRGVSFYSQNMDSIVRNKLYLYNNLRIMIDKNWFKVISFDNLAIEQLKPYRLMSDEKWSEFYMGDDGKFTMYIDLVNQEYAKSSISIERFRIEDDIKKMFEKI